MTDTSDDHDDLPQRLFAEATARLEDALEATVRGQAPRVPTDEQLRAATDALFRLDSARRLVEAIAVVAGPTFERPDSDSS